MDKKNLKLLDCTFRDGGYYTNWNFTNDFLSSYLNIVDKGIVDIVEIGLRTIQSSEYLGPYAYTPIDFFCTCKSYKKIKFSTLVNWSDICDSFDGFKKLFPGVENDFINIVRVVVKTIHLDEIEKYIYYLKENGYEVSLNIQKCDSLFNEEEYLFKKKIKSFKPDILYLADTNGHLDPQNTYLLIKKIIDLIDIPLGVHMHNNQGLAYANTLQAIEGGATYLDSTFSGIGRGPGNTQTEYLSCFVKELSQDKILSIVEITEKYFNPLKKKYLWGENYFYFLSGLNNQSASLMHNLMNNKSYSNMSLVNISTSNEEDSISLIAKKYNSDFKYLVDKPKAVIIANGESWKPEENEIIKYLEENDLLKIHINYPVNQRLIPQIDYFCSCDPIKIIDDLSLYNAMNNIPLICPENILNETKIDIEKLNRINYCCYLSENNIDITKESCVIPSIQSLCYGLSFLYSKGYKNILLIGIEGFKLASKNVELINCINFLNIKYSDLEITGVNPNRLGIRTKSIFEIRNLS